MYRHIIVLVIKFASFILLANGIGFLMSLPYGETQWLSALFLFLLTAGLTNIHALQTLKWPRKALFLLSIFAIPILYFTTFYSTISALLFFTIILLLLMKKQFMSLKLTYLFRIIEWFIFVVILNSFSFYSQTFFLNLTVTLYLIAIYSTFILLALFFKHLRYSRESN